MDLASLIPPDNQAGRVVLSKAAEGIWPFNWRDGVIFVDYNIDDNEYRVVVEFKVGRMILWASCRTNSEALFEIEQTAPFIGLDLMYRLRNRDSLPIPNNIILGEE